MIKKIFSLALVAAMLLSFAACSNDGEGGLFNVQTIPEDAFTTVPAGEESSELSDEELAAILESLDIDPNNPDAIQDLMIEEGSEDIDFEFGSDLIDDSNSNKIDVELNENGRPDRSKMDGEFAEIFKQDKFTLKMNIRTVSAGEEMNIPLTMIKNGEELYTELTVPVQEKGGVMRVATLASKDGNYYMIMPTMRMYMAVPTESMGDMLPSDLSEIISEENVNSTYIETREVEIDGKTYICDVYEDDGVTGKHYYDESGIKRVEYTDGDDISIMEITELTNTADQSKFKLPAGYINMEKILGKNYSGLAGLN